MFKKLMIINGILLFLIVLFTLNLFFSWKDWRKKHNVNRLVEIAKATKPGIKLPEIENKVAEDLAKDIEYMSENNIFHKDRNSKIPESKNPDMEIRLGNPPVILGISILGDEKFAMVKPKMNTSQISGTLKLKEGDLWLNDWKVSKITAKGIVLESVRNPDDKHEIEYQRSFKRAFTRKSGVRNASVIKHITVFDFEFGKGIKGGSYSRKSGNGKKGGVKVVTVGGSSGKTGNRRILGGRGGFNRSGFGGSMGGGFGGSSRFGGGYGGYGGYGRSSFGGRYGGYNNFGGRYGGRGATGQTYRPRLY